MTAEHPWTPAAVPVAEVRLDVDWPRACPPRILRGAVLAQMMASEGSTLHSDWHGHLNGPEGGMSRPAPICYRIEPSPRLYLWGDRAHDHATRAAEVLRSLRLPGGDVLDIRSVDLDLRTEAAGVDRRWYGYDLVTPLYPAAVAWGRRPRAPGRFRRAWAGTVIRRSILDLLGAMGKGDAVGSPLHVDVDDYRDVRLEWARPEREVREHVEGFRCSFAANVQLPDGIGLGHHRAEGFGEIRRVAEGVRL